MDQIRNTMIQHEALFKEQVQALHNLYNIQKSAMQEIRRRLYSHCQVLAFNSRSVELADDRSRRSVLDGKPSRPAYGTCRAYKEESLTLSFHPSCTLEEYKGCDSLWMDGGQVETPHSVQSKPMRNFDLEKLPEEYMDDSEIQVEQNSSKISDAKSLLFERTANTNGSYFLGANLPVIQVDSSRSKQRYPETDIETLSVLDQEVNLSCDRFSGGKVCGTDIKECVTSFPGQNSTTESNMSQEFPQKFLHAVGDSHAYQDSTPSTKIHVGKGSLVFTPQSSNPVQSIKVHLEEIPRQANSRIVEGSLLKNPVICSQGSSTLESVQCESTNCNGSFLQRPLSFETNSVLGKQDLHSVSLTSQTSLDGEDENNNDSGNGSNSIQSQDAKSCKDKNTSIHTEDTSGLGDDCCEKGQRSHGRREVVQSKHEVLQFIQDGSGPLSSTLSGSGIKCMDHSTCSNSNPKSLAILEEPIVVTESNEKLKDGSALHEASESIAAEILLSFAPGRSQVDSHLQGTQVKPDSNNSSGDDINIDKKCNLHERRYTNHRNGGGINESIKWAKSVNRRRTSRRRQ